MRSAPASASGERAVSFPSTDGFLLSGTVFEPEHRNGLSVLVSSGYAIPRTLYGPYARFFLRVPLAARLGGWFPRLRRGRFAVPRGVALEFAAWGRNPAFIVDERGAPLREHFDRYAGRVRLYRISDDVDFAPRRAVEALAGFFPGAAVEVTPRTPAEWGVPRVGHFGFFDRALARVAWPETAHWLEWAGGAPLPPAVPARKQSGSARPLTAAAQPG